jgi:hypothetical protein
MVALRQCHLVGEEDERLAGFGVLESHTAQMNGVVLLRVEAVERNRLIANDAGWPICLRRVDAMEVHVRLGPRDEESAGQMQNVKASEIDVATIHDVDGTGLGYQQVERMHIVQLAVGDMDEARNAATQVEQRMHLHCGLGRAEVRPRKHRQAQVDGRRIQCIRPCSTSPAPSPHWHTALWPEQSDVARSRHRCASRATRWHRPASSAESARESPCDRAWPPGRQTHFDVAQALAVGQLGEGHDPELLRAGQRANALVATVARDVPDEASSRAGNP